MRGRARAGFDARHLEHVVDDLQQRLPRLQRDFEIAPLRRRFGDAQRQVGQAEHAVQRRADLVAHVGQEARLGGVRAVGLVAPQLGLPLVGDVAGRAGDDLGAAVGAGPDAAAAAHPAPAAVLVEKAQLVAERPQRADRFVVGGEERADVVAVDARVDRLAVVRQLVRARSRTARGSCPSTSSDRSAGRAPRSRPASR